MRIGALYPVAPNVKVNNRIQNLNILMSAPSHRTASRGPSLCVLWAPFDAAAVSGEKVLWNTSHKSFHWIPLMNAYFVLHVEYLSIPHLDGVVSKSRDDFGVVVLQMMPYYYWIWIKTLGGFHLKYFLRLLQLFRQDIIASSFSTWRQ